MKRAVVLLALLCALVFSFVPACGEDSPAPADQGKQTITVIPSAKPGEVREYKIDYSFSGDVCMPNAEKPSKVNMQLASRVRHQYRARGEDGVLPLEISFLEGQVTVEDQTMRVEPGIYPRLTVMLDRSWQVTGVYGITDDPSEEEIPGFRYSNIMALFYPYGMDTPRAVGDTWKTTVKLPGTGETFVFTNTLKKVQDTGGTKTMDLHQETSRTSPNGMTMNAAIDSSFAAENGKLLKSHVEGTVVSAAKAPTAKGDSETQQEQPGTRANIKVDIALAK